MRLVLQPPRWWWTAIAHEHERRRESVQTLRLTMDSDLPVYGLTTNWEGSRHVQIGFCHATFRKGPLGLRVQEGPVVVDEIMARHEASDGGALTVTSHRGGNRQVDRGRLVSNFLSISWVIDQDNGDDSDGARRADATTPGSEPASGDAEWAAWEVRVDGTPRRFERLGIAGHWLALGAVGDHLVSIEGHGVTVDAGGLSTVSDVPAWVHGPDSPTSQRFIVQLGDRLGDLLGLP